MLIYTRTVKGNALALNPLLPLSRNLRNLLMAIDGSMETYSSRISAFEGVETLLASLLKDGLIRVSSEERVGKVHASPRSEPDFADTDADFMAIDHAHDPLGTTSNLFAEDANESSGFSAEDLSSWVRLRPATPAPYPPSVYPRAARAERHAPSINTAQLQFQNALSLISDFAETYMPDTSLEVILTFESLGSVEQLLGHLKDYQTLIAPLGEPAKIHFARLRKVLTTS